MWGQATQLPWGKPYLQDLKNTLLHNDPGYVEAKRWWTESRAQDEARTHELAGMRAEIERLHTENSNYESEKNERSADRLDFASSLRSVPRTEAPTRAGAEVRFEADTEPPHFG
jgi:hypothetical protein